VAALVLVIDDDDRLRELYRLNFEHRGLRVIEASGGDEGLALARRDHPALIVLDLTMPGTDGFGVLEELGKDDDLAGIPVVVLTGHADEEVESKARAAGAWAYVAKPVDTDDLVRLVLGHAALQQG
jgi:CheY-like chemotaxis protein